MNIPDQAERELAMLTDGHAFARASAGTGKTHTLAMRALYLLLTAPFQKRAKGTECERLYTAQNRVERLRAAHAVIRRFVLTTFTRKAAAEMQTRLYEYLNAIVSGASLHDLRAQYEEINPPLVLVVEKVLNKLAGADDVYETLRRGAEALAELATEFQVSTIHSFAAAMLRRHPIAAGIPPHAQFAEEDDATTPDVTGQTIDRWWQEVLADVTLRTELETLLRILSLSQIRQWLENVFRHPWLAREMKFIQPDKQTVREILKASRLLTRALSGLKRAKKARELEPVLAGLLAEIEAGKDRCWWKFCRFLADNDEVLFDVNKRAKELDSALNSLGELRRYFDDYYTIYTPALQNCLLIDFPSEWATWVRFVEQYAGWADGVAVRELGLVTFDDMMRLSVKMLRERPDIRREERRRLWAILVDEFQDTDPVQLELLELLLKRDGQDAHHEVVGFFVGDGKQSIYRFRGADLPGIHSFVDKFPTIISGDKNQIGNFTLTTSFRTVEPITKFVNYLFENHLRLPDYAKERLSPIRETPQVPVLPEWRLLRPSAQNALVRAQRECAAWETARIIADYRQDNAGKGDRAYNDILVLVNSHDELDALSPVLIEAGIPVISSGARTFYVQPEVLDVLNLLIAAVNPQDPLAVGALLRSPLIGLSDEAIHRMLLEVRTAEVFHSDNALSASTPGNAGRRITQVRELVRDRVRCSLTEWVRRLRRFIPAGVYARQDVEGRALARIENVLAAFYRVVEIGRIEPLAWLLEQRSRADKAGAHDADLGEDVGVTDESMAAVRVMTIHKSKGLEGSFVIVYGWQKTLNRRFPRPKDTDKPLSLTGRDGKPVRGFRLPWGQLEVVSPRYSEAERLDREYDAEEGLRLAYVAATRARDRLVLFSQDCKEITNGILKEAQSLIDGKQATVLVFGDTLRVSVYDPPQAQAGETSTTLDIADKTAYATVWNQRLQAAKLEPKPLLAKPSQLPERPEEDDAVETTDYMRRAIGQARTTAMAAGTLVHRYLEMHLLDDAFVAGNLQIIASPDVGQVSGTEIVGRVTEILKRFFGSELHTRARKAKILGREVPVYLSLDGKQWSGTIDLIIEENGAIIGVDYKVTKKPAELPTEYEQQKRIYTVALRRILGRDPASFEFWWLA